MGPFRNFVVMCLLLHRRSHGPKVSSTSDPKPQLFGAEYQFIGKSTLFGSIPAASYHRQSSRCLAEARGFSAGRSRVQLKRLPYFLIVGPIFCSQPLFGASSQPHSEECFLQLVLWLLLDCPCPIFLLILLHFQFDLRDDRSRQFPSLSFARIDQRNSRRHSVVLRCSMAQSLVPRR